MDEMIKVDLVLQLYVDGHWTALSPPYVSELAHIPSMIRGCALDPAKEQAPDFRHLATWLP